MARRHNPTAEKTAYTREEVLGREPSAYLVALATLGLCCIGIAAFIPIMHGGFDHGWYRYLFAAGALMVLVARLFTPYTGTLLRMKRLHRMEAWSGIFFCVAAFFMFYEPAQNRDWLAFTMAGAVIQIVATFMMAHVARKALNIKK